MPRDSDSQRIDDEVCRFCGDTLDHFYEIEIIEESSDISAIAVVCETCAEALSNATGVSLEPGASGWFYIDENNEISGVPKDNN